MAPQDSAKSQSNGEVAEAPTEPQVDVTVDSPWTYTAFIPISFLPYKWALYLFTILQLAAMGAIMLWGLYASYDMFRHRSVAILLALQMGLLIYVQTDLHVGNLGLICAAAACGLLYTLDRKMDWSAGIFAFLLILKPQAGVLIFIPLLIGKKYRTILTAGILCLIFSIVSSCLIHQWPWEIMYDTYVGGKRFINQPALAGFLGILHPMVPLNQILLIEMVTGAVAVILLSYWLRNAEHWFIRLLPALIISTMWTYSRIYHLNVLALLLWVVAVLFMESRNLKHAVMAVAVWLGVAWPLFNYAPAGVYLFKHLCLIIALFYILHTYRNGQLELYKVKSK